MNSLFALIRYRGELIFFFFIAILIRSRDDIHPATASYRQKKRVLLSVESGERSEESCFRLSGA